MTCITKKIMSRFFLSCAVRDLYNEATCITKGFGGPKHFVIKTFDGSTLSLARHNWPTLDYSGPQASASNGKLSLSKQEYEGAKLVKILHKKPKRARRQVCQTHQVNTRNMAQAHTGKRYTVTTRAATWKRAGRHQQQHVNKLRQQQQHIIYIYNICICIYRGIKHETGPTTSHTKKKVEGKNSIGFTHCFNDKRVLKIRP